MHFARLGDGHDVQVLVPRTAVQARAHDVQVHLVPAILLGTNDNVNIPALNQERAAAETADYTNTLVHVIARCRLISHSPSWLRVGSASGRTQRRTQKPAEGAEGARSELKWQHRNN